MDILKNPIVLDADIDVPAISESPLITQGDTIEFTINVLKSREPFILDSSMTATLVVRRSDGEVIIAKGEVNGTNQVVFKLRRKATLVLGTTRFTVQLYDKDLERVSTMFGVYVVMEDMSDRLDHLPEDEQGLIQQVLGDGPAVIEAATQAAVRVDNFIGDELESGMLRTRIDEKLTDLEVQYAPKLNQVTSQLADIEAFTKVSLPKIVSEELTATGLANTDTVTISESNHGIEVGDDIAIQNAGFKKNSAAFLISFLTKPSVDGNITIIINSVSYVIAATTSDTPTTLGAKLVALNLPYTLISSGTDVLYSAGDYPLSVAIDIGATGATTTYQVDNEVEYNYLRSKVVEVSGSVIKLNNVLQRNVTDVAIKLDHTDLIQKSFNHAVNETVYFENQTYNIFDKLAVIYDVPSFTMVGTGDSSLIDATGIVGTKTPYAFSRNICYYTDGNVITFANSENLKFERLKMVGKEQTLIKYTDTAKVTFDNTFLEMKKSKNMNHSAVSVYSTANGANPTNYRFRNARFKTGGMAIIFLGDFANPINDIKFNDGCRFEMQDERNFETLKLTELVKFDNNTYDAEITGCYFDGGELSSITIEEGCDNINIHDNDFNETDNQFVRIAVGQTKLTNTNIKINKNRFKKHVFGIRVEAASGIKTVNGLEIDGNTVDMGTEADTSTFALINNVLDLEVNRTKFKNTSNSTASLILISDSEKVRIDGNDIPEMGNVDIGQIRVINSKTVDIIRNKVPVVLMRYITDGHLLDNQIKARAEFQNNYDIEIRGNGLNLDDLQVVASYFPILKITSDDSLTDTGVYDISFNRAKTKRNAKWITDTTGTKIAVAQSHNRLIGFPDQPNPS